MSLSRSLTFLFLICCSLIERDDAFQPLACASAPSLMDSIQSIFGSMAGASNSVDEKRREELKAVLLDECRSAGVGKDKRERIERVLKDLAPLSPIRDTATSPLLQKKWLL